MTPTEKDAMALAVLSDVVAMLETIRHSGTAKATSEARAHLASRIAELGAEIANLRTMYSDLMEVAGGALENVTARATLAEAELAAVRANAERYLHLREANNADPTPFIAQRYEHGIMQWTGEEADAAIDAARGGE